MSKHLVTMNELIEDYSRTIDKQNAQIEYLLQEVEELQESFPELEFEVFRVSVEKEDCV